MTNLSTSTRSSSSTTTLGPPIHVASSSCEEKKQATVLGQQTGVIQHLSRQCTTATAVGAAAMAAKER